MVYVPSTNSLVYSGGAERPILGEEGAVDYRHTWMYSFDNITAGWVEKGDIGYLGNHMSFSSAKDENGMDHQFILGGHVGENNEYANVDENWEWDPVNEGWIERANMPFPRGHASSSTRAISCGIIVAAGAKNTGGSTRDISFYDVPTDTWTSIGSLPRALNTPVCDIDFEDGYFYCESGFVDGRFSVRRRIQY